MTIQTTGHVALVDKLPRPSKWLGMPCSKKSLGRCGSLIYIDNMLIAPNNPIFHEKCVPSIWRNPHHDQYINPKSAPLNKSGSVPRGNPPKRYNPHGSSKTQWVADCHGQPTSQNTSFLGHWVPIPVFIPNYSKIVRPLLDLTQKATPAIGTNTQTSRRTSQHLICLITSTNTARVSRIHQYTWCISFMAWVP